MHRQWIFLGIGVILLGLVGLRLITSVQADGLQDDGARDPVVSSEAVERQQAAVELADQGRIALPEIRALAQTSADPKVRAIAVQGMGDVYDYDSLDRLIGLMDDPSPLVRARAYGAVSRMIGLQTDFDPHGPAAQRREIMEVYRLEWQAIRNSKAVREFKVRADQRYGEMP